MHEVVEVTKLLGSLYLCGCFLRERCDACNLQHHGVRAIFAHLCGKLYIKMDEHVCFFKPNFG